MPVIFLEKGVNIPIPEGFKKAQPRTRQQKLKYKVDLLKQITASKTGVVFTPANLEKLGEEAEKLLLSNTINIYEKADNSMNTNVNTYNGVEEFAPEDYAVALSAANNAVKAAKKAEREEVKKAIHLAEGALAGTSGLGANSLASVGAFNTGIVSRNNAMSGVRRHEEYLQQSKALYNEAVAALRTPGLNKNTKHKALKQMKLAKSYKWLADTALEQYKRNLSKSNLRNTMEEQDGGLKRLTRRKQRATRRKHTRKH